MSAAYYLSQLLGSVKPGQLLHLPGVDADKLLYAAEKGKQSADDLHFSTHSHLGRLRLDLASTRDLRRQILDAMATLLLGLWPDWLPEARGISEDGGDAAQTAVVSVAEAHANNSDAFGPWLTQAALQAFSGILPRTFDIAPEVEIREQVRAISVGLGVHYLCLAVKITHDASKDIHIDSVPQTLDWTARHGSVAIFLCTCHPQHSYLSRLPSCQLVIPNELRCQPEESGATETEQSPLQVATVEGRPNPSSTAEVLMARLLKIQSWAGYYAHNRTINIDPLFQARPDLLWPDERVVVELDGADHRTPQKYYNDRDRDYRLSINGYRILRLTNEEILDDSAKALEKIHYFLEFCRNNPVEGPSYEQ